MNGFLKKLTLLTALAVIAGLQSGCDTVKPWQRKTLADYTMLGDRDPLGEALMDHVYFSREMAFGGKGIGGGGCGCN
jgi:hypothetical protein